MVARGLSHFGPFVGLLLLCETRAVFAQDPGENLPTNSSFRSTNYARLFRRATTPGPGGAIVTTEGQLPVVLHVSYWASGIDTRLGHDTASMEVSGWQAVDGFGREGAEADVQTAYLSLHTASRAPAAWLTLGRQIRAGGAARFARFDGISSGISPHPALTLRAYGGYRVLPRFDQQPGYHHLGASPDVLLNDPAVLEPLDRNKYSVVGGDVRVDAQSLHASISVHDETDNGAIGRRNLGLDVSAKPWEKLDVGGAVLVDLDSLRWSSARAFVDYFATPHFDLSGQYVRAEPALLLSRQSVLSVFSTSNYQEFGIAGRFRVFRMLSLSGSAFAQDYEDSGNGARLSGEFRAHTDGSHVSTFVAGYTRVSTFDGGYHSARGALSQELAQRLTGTLQSFLYFYDIPSYDRSTSMSHAVTIDYQLSDSWDVLWGGSLASSPYADFDAATQVRMSYSIDGRSL